MPGTVRSATLSQFDTTCRAVGLDPEALLAEVDLTPMVLRDPDLRIPGRKVADLIHMAAARSGNSDFGMRMGSLRGLEDWGLVGLAARDLPTLRDYFEFLLVRGHYQNENASARLARHEDHMNITLDFQDTDARRSAQATEMTMVFNLRCIEDLLGRPVQPSYISFRHTRISDLSTYRKFLGVEPQFCAERLTLALPMSALNLPIAGAKPQFAATLGRILGQQGTEGSPQYSHAVTKNLRALIGTIDFSIERMAKLLDTTPRTLQRKLRDEGTSYSEIIDEVRTAMAKDHVELSDRPLSQVSDILGFKSQSALAHWYRQKHGVSALEQRRRARAR